MADNTQVTLIEDENLTSNPVDLEPTSIVKYNRETKTLMFTTNFTVINDKDLLEVFNNVNNIELIMANLSVATKQYLEFLTDNVKTGELGSLVKVLSK